MAGAPFVTVGGPLPTVRETEAPPNPEVVEMIAAAARAEVPKRGESRSDELMAISVVMPALEMAQETGKLVSWLKKEGEQVAKGEMLLEVETDKAVVEIEAGGDGILGGVTAKEGDVVPVGQTIAWLLQPGEAAAAATARPAQTGRKMDAAPAAAAAAAAPAAPEPVRPRARASRRRRADWRRSTASTSRRVRGSGPGGEILADDILKRRADVAPAAPAATAARPRRRLRRLRSGRARSRRARSAASWPSGRRRAGRRVPHFFVTRDVDATALNAARERLIPVIETVARREGHAHRSDRRRRRARAAPASAHERAAGSTAAITLNADVNVALAMAVENAVVTA